MKYSPIALFVYKRPDHTRRTLEALMKCPEFSESPLYIFCDGAKRSEDQALVEQTREVVRSLVGDQTALIESSHNQGLAPSIITGVTQLLKTYDRIIVLEDDLIVSPKFLEYMNRALELYKDNRQVMQVSGYIFPVREFTKLSTALFFPYINSWGWATWRDAWQIFDPNVSGYELLETNPYERKRFNLDGYYNFYDVLKLYLSSQVDSWAIRWYWSVFKNNGLTVFPPVTYVVNTGRDSGTHSSLLGGVLERVLGFETQVLSLDSIDLPSDPYLSQEYYSFLKRSLRLFSLKNTLGILKRKLLRNFSN
jgi:hypothetical protein